MKKKDTATIRAKKKMEELQDARQQEESTVRARIKDLKERLREAESTLKDATRATDLDAFTTADNEKKHCLTALRMYEAREAQLQGLSMITEDESDAMIDDLLEYEKELQEDFEKDIADHLAALAEIVANYDKEVTDTERTLTTWQNTIHANYRTFGRGFYLDKEAGVRVAKSPYPIPVHNTPYTGCDAFNQLKDYLKKSGVILY